MRRATSLVLAALLVLGCQKTRGTNETLRSPPAAIRAETGAALQSLLDASVRRSKGFGGGVLRIESPTRGVLWEGAAGLAASRRDAPMQVNATFEVASVTKTFTAASVLMLVEDGRLDLDAPLGSLLESAVTQDLLVVRGHDYGPEITVRQLLAHTSGLPDYWSDGPLEDGANAFITDFLSETDRFWGPRVLLGYARKLRPIGVPGARYRYSDTGYVLLGLVIERATGKKLDQVFRERILTPLAMTDTYMSYHEPPRVAAESHRYEEALDLHGERRQSADWGGGGLVSSARDLTRFLFALAQHRLFRNPGTLETMMAWRPTGMTDIDYGLGLFHIRLDGGRGQLWGHDGHGNAFMYYWPERELAFVGTLNQTQNSWWDLVSDALVKIGDGTGATRNGEDREGGGSL